MQCTNKEFIGYSCFVCKARFSIHEKSRIEINVKEPEKNKELMQTILSFGNDVKVHLADLLMPIHFGKIEMQ